jgi:hypothetical protein
MPLPRGSQAGGGQTPGTPTTPGRVVIPEIGEYTPTWHAPDGTVLELNPAGSKFFSLKSVAGLGAVPLDIVTQPAADGGVTVELERPLSRTIVWPIRIRGDTHTEFVARWREVTDLFTQTKRLGPGRLRITRPDGSAREIIAHYSKGLEQDPEDGAWTQVTAPVSLLCPDGYWLNTEPVARQWAQETQPDFLDPFPTISSGQVIGAASLRNNGVADAWPSWSIRGPMTSLTATNVTRGETFVLTYALAAGEVLTMGTRPIEVRGPGGVQAIGALNLLAGGIPWRVDAKSTTDIQFTAAGAEPPSTPGGTDGTSISATFYERFETA